VIAVVKCAVGVRIDHVEDLSNSIQTNAEGPKKASGDSGSMTPAQAGRTGQSSREML